MDILKQSGFCSSFRCEDMDHGTLRFDPLLAVLVGKRFSEGTEPTRLAELTPVKSARYLKSSKTQPRK